MEQETRTCFEEIMSRLQNSAKFKETLLRRDLDEVERDIDHIQSAMDEAIHVGKESDMRDFLVKEKVLQDKCAKLITKPFKQVGTH